MRKGNLASEQPELGIGNPNSIMVPTSDLKAELDRYGAMGFQCDTVYAGKFYRSKSEGKLWTLHFWRPDPRYHRCEFPVDKIPLTP